MNTSHWLATAALVELREAFISLNEEQQTALINLTKSLLLTELSSAVAQDSGEETMK